jgi:ABC-2 type transport system ATP-binding protein
MIKVQGISKIYNGVSALSDVNLTVAAGQVLGIVGSNGSGRTTLLRILATQLKPTAGQVHIDGIDAMKHPFRARPKIGYLAQSQSFYDSMTVGEFMKFVASCQNEKIDKSSMTEGQPFEGLSPELSLRALSHGSRQKLALTAILIHKPSLLILDEPMTHLDPIAIKQFHALVKNFQFQGGTILMACNRTGEIPALCDEVAFMHQGSILQTTRISGLNINVADMFMNLVNNKPKDAADYADFTDKIIK